MSSPERANGHLAVSKLVLNFSRKEIITRILHWEHAFVTSKVFELYGQAEMRMLAFLCLLLETHSCTHQPSAHTPQHRCKLWTKMHECRDSWTELEVSLSLCMDSAGVTIHAYRWLLANLIQPCSHWGDPSAPRFLVQDCINTSNFPPIRTIIHLCPRKWSIWPGA